MGVRDSDVSIGKSGALLIQRGPGKPAFPEGLGSILNVGGPALDLEPRGKIQGHRIQTRTNAPRPAGDSLWKGHAG